MSEIKYSRNYRDLSKSFGVESGFQFEFSCERCNDTWRSSFRPYRGGQISGWASRIGMMFGGVFRQAGLAADGIARAGWSDARDNAFKDAVQELERHFNRCSKCNRHVCATCWNVDTNSCLNCAPDVKAKPESSASSANANESSLKSPPEQEKSHVACPKCNAETQGTKFCPSCGYKISAHLVCSTCHTKLQPGMKFCGECGQAVAE